MKILHLIVKGRIPSKKNNRRGFSVHGKIPASQNYLDWRMDAGLQLLKYKGSNLTNVDIQIEFWMPDNRRCDLDNKVTSIFDLLKELNIIEDDCWQCLGSYYVKAGGIDKINPRADIWIREIGK